MDSALLRLHFSKRKVSYTAEFSRIQQLCGIFLDAAALLHEENPVFCYSSISLRPDGRSGLFRLLVR